jgi:DNA-binding transcriptional LysR family regulator
MPLLTPASTLVDEIARFGSIRKAAERLNASPSAVNRQLLNLETELGVSLFERLARGVRPTAAGEALLFDIRRWRREEERLLAHLQELQGLRSGRLSIGIMECMAFDLGPAAIAAFRDQHPQVMIDVLVGGTQAIAEQMVAGALGVAVAFNLPPWSEMRVMWTRKLPLTAVVAPGHPLASLSEVEISDCVRYPLHAPSRSLALRSIIEEALPPRVTSQIASLTTNSTEFIKASLAGSNGVAFLGVLDVYREVKAGTLAAIPLRSNPEMNEEIVIAIPQRAAGGSLAAFGAAIMKEHINRVIDANQQPRR